MVAQVHYVRFPSTQDRVAQEWLRATQLIIESGASAVVTSSTERGRAGSVVGWRLVSDNHREIARGSRLHPSERAAGFDAATLARRAAERRRAAARHRSRRPGRRARFSRLQTPPPAKAPLGRIPLWQLARGHQGSKKCF
ncbi:hypothetical protein, partial [uncultured Microbacterium sp.]|uniref:hypothetical protein n=1 Tax=uncultured Microbacterium sp. TaxID=191216 RepID=UPI00258A6133